MDACAHVIDVHGLTKRFGRRTVVDGVSLAVRRGEIVGIHEVLVSTPTQTITLRHEAHSRALFAEGALDAARFLCTQGPGLYNMNSMIV